MIFFFNMQTRMKIFLKLPSFDFRRETGGGAMTFYAKQLFRIAKVGHVLGFLPFCEEQQFKNCASGQPGHKIEQKLSVLLLL